MESRLVVLSCLLATAFGSFLEVNYPDVNVSAERNGDAIFEAGTGGSVFLEPGAGGTVYVAGVDLKKFIERVKSLPPVWTKRSEHASLGTFYSGQNFRVSVDAVDPEGGKIVYSIISGHLPQGAILNKTTGEITGTAPDLDATYTFGIRGTDVHGKFADGVFTLDIRERDQCGGNPCYNGGTCTDAVSSFNCSCVHGYGGARCQTKCDVNAFGVGSSVKKIPDAQLSGHLTYSTFNPWNGRMGSSSGWVGTDKRSWLQVDLGAIRDVYAVVVQGYKSSSYYIASYKVSTSGDGNTFVYASSAGSNIFAGSANYDDIIKHSFDTAIQARFLRFIPETWHAGGYPGMRVEVYGC